MVMSATQEDRFYIPMPVDQPLQFDIFLLVKQEEELLVVQLVLVSLEETPLLKVFKMSIIELD